MTDQLRAMGLNPSVLGTDALTYEIQLSLIAQFATTGTTYAMRSCARGESGAMPSKTAARVIERTGAG